MSNPMPSPGEAFRGEDGTVSTILPDFYDPNYEPSREELEEYATCIGINPATEQDLMWIALEGLRAPLPSGWRACETEVEDEDGDGEEKKEVYYFNFETGESLWDHPMDEVFREKANAERAKRPSGGAARPSATAASSSLPRPLAGETHKVTPGTTKSIANALFGGNKGATDGARLGSVSQMDSGIGGSRGLPDVSDLLGSANSSGIGNVNNSSAFLGGLRPFGQSSGLPGSPGASGSPRGPVTMKEVEANLRKRIEDEYAPSERAEELRRDREIIEERAKLEREVTALREQLDRAWQADNNKTDAERLADVDAEAKTIEDGWTQRLDDERKRVKAVEDQISAKQAEIRALKEDSVATLKAQLAEQNAAEIKARREALTRDVDAELAKKEAEREIILNELRVKGEQSVATARSRLEADHKKQQDVKASFDAKRRAAAEAEVKRLEQELAEQETRLKQIQSRATPNTSSPPAPSSAGTDGLSIDALTAALAAVEAEAAAAEAQHKDRLAKLNVEYTVKCDTVRSQIRRKEKEALEQSNTSFTAASATTSSAQEKKDEEAAERLKTLEATLKRQLEEAKAKYEKETESLVAKAKAAAESAAAREKEKEKEKATPSVATKAPDTSTNSANASGLDSTISPQEQRTKDAENTRHILSLKQLETKHEQMVRQIREKHHKALTASKRLDPRTAANYAKEMTARKRTWLTEHPAPQADMPELAPIPKMVSMMGDMPAVEPPTEEEQNAYLQQRLTEMRETLAAEEEEAKKTLTEKKRSELDALAESYRSERLEVINKKLCASRQQAAASAQAAAAAATTAGPSSSTPASTTTRPAAASPAVSPADLAALKALEDEQRTLAQALEAARAAAATAKTAYETESATLRARLSTAETQLAAAKSSAAAAAANAPKSTPNTPLAALSKKPSVVFEPDLETYIPNDEAAAEEAALKEKYHAELARLKASAAHEMELYESAMQQLAQAREAATQRQLPPPAPASSATPLNRSAIASEEAALAATATPGFSAMATPMHVGRTPLVHRGDSVPSGGGMPLFGSQTSQPGNASLNASSIHPGSVAPFFSPHHQRVPPMFLAEDADGEVDMPAPTGRLSGFMEPSPVPPPMRAAPHHGPLPLSGIGAVEEGEGGADGPLFPHDEVYEERLRNVQLALRARRSSLRARQARLEGLREEWRHDMSVCRAAKDHTQARALKQVKLQLEEQARQLNEAVAETKQAGLQLKQEKQRYEAYLMGGPAAVERCNVLMLLEEVATKTARLEHTILQDRPRDHSTVRASGRAASAHAHGTVTARQSDPERAARHRDGTNMSGKSRSISAGARARSHERLASQLTAAHTSRNQSTVKSYETGGARQHRSTGTGREDPDAEWLHDSY